MPANSLDALGASCSSAMDPRSPLWLCLSNKASRMNNEEWNNTGCRTLPAVLLIFYFEQLEGIQIPSPFISSFN